MQILNHFNYDEPTYWNQRYWVFDTHFNPQKGAVFIYICGEWTCGGTREIGGWVSNLAQKN